MNPSFPFAGDLFPELARLQQHLDDLFQPTTPASIRAASRNAFPAVNVGTTSDAVEVLAFVPGVDPKSLQVTVEKSLLVITGDRARDAACQAPGANLYAQERFAGSFRRVISLPDDADPAQVDARLNEGVLRVSVAKRESSKPRQIAIN